MSVRARQKEETRANLLAAASQTFAARGWSATMVGDIARAAGVAHGTFYVHFADKAAIAEVLLAEFNRRLAETLVRAAAVVPDREGKVRAVARAFLRTLEQERDFVLWYEQRLAEGMPRDALSLGINPEARELLDGWLRAEGLSPERGRLLALGLLALWIRIGLAGGNEAEEVLVGATLGAIGGVR